MKEFYLGEIYTKVFEPEQKPTAVIQYIHGFGEHTGRYTELADRFAKAGAAFVMHDQRGHGKTSGARGVARDYAQLLDDAAALRGYIEENFPGTPIILYGHSMGGNIAANILLSPAAKKYHKAVLGSPWFRLKNPPAPIVVGVAGILGKISPNLAIVNKLPFVALTHDEEIVAAVAADKEYHNRISFRLVSQITAAGERAIREAGKIAVPTMVLCAGGDEIVDPRAVREFAEGNPFVFKEYPGLRHELHNEIERETIFADVKNFCFN